MKRIAREQLEPFVTKDKSIIREIYRSEVMSLAEALVPPEKETLYHFHETSEEVYYILEGRGMMRVEGEQREVKNDHTIVLPKGTKHNIKNIGEGDLRILCISIPPYTHEDTVMEE